MTRLILLFFALTLVSCYTKEMIYECKFDVIEQSLILNNRNKTFVFEQIAPFSSEKKVGGKYLIKKDTIILNPEKDILIGEDEFLGKVLLIQKDTRLFYPVNGKLSSLYFEQKK